ncbi:SDR family oxidoreductase [Aureimonas pseudogalii]|uniref:NAD(P)-dependent dehydrogenase (Short-subunit alcohol dehydrogenase family) n=1 Tax=Aureimonas pseudogalii TaxID=1744844 RepID=A0A7W6H7G5_9HYPH|nr:SDR family oxidoreductase [Aureimonas pseudogalii]MBB3999917.1 NAD(P)-dependent dehydrogenase (short-subunit alcohol dehydrogenase family) [Aureimonas pseudogalii]
MTTPLPSADAKVALVVGGGSGLGAAAARALATEGFRVAIFSSSGRGEALAAELGGFGMTGSNLVPADLERFVAGALDRFGRIDAVVSSAGHGPKGPVLDITDEDWHRAMEFYLLNVVRIARLVTPIMQGAGRGGSFVNVSTYAAFEPEADFPTSGVFRAGLASFAKLFADQYGAEGLRMNNVLPGFIDSLPKKEERRGRIPMGRYGRADEVADLIAFLAGDRSTYITGQNIRIDGGITRSV